MTSVQSLDTMGKLKEINGYVRRTIDKLPGIRANLVRIDSDWHYWDFGQFVEQLRQWTERNLQNIKNVKESTKQYNRTVN